MMSIILPASMKLELSEFLTLLFQLYASMIF